MAACCRYTDRRTGNLAVVDLPTNSVRLLTSDGNLSGPGYASVSTFSGDSRSIAYAWFLHDCQCAQLRTISVDGGQPTVAVTFTGVDEILPISWSRDGRNVAAWVSTPKEVSGYTLEIIDIARQERRVIGAGEVGLASFSPDGRHVVFARLSGPDSRVHDIYIADVDRGKAAPLITGPGNKSAPLWSADGQHVLFLSRGTGTMSLWAQQVAAGRASAEPFLISRNLGTVWPLGVSDQGSYYYMIEAQSSEVLVARVKVAEGRILEQPRRITSTAGASESPDWSPDGRWLAWRTVPPPFSLVVRDTVSGDERALSSVINVGPGPRWSPDGRSLLVRAGEGPTRGLYIVDVQSGTLRGPFLNTRPIGDTSGILAVERRFSWTSRSGVSLLDFQSGSEKRVYTPPSGWSHGRGLALSPDGKKLAAVLIKDGTFVISVMSLGTQVTREILRIQRPDVIILGRLDAGRAVSDLHQRPDGRWCECGAARRDVGRSCRWRTLHVT